MLDQNSQSFENALDKLSLVAHALRFLSSQQEGTDLGALLQLLGINLEKCLLALDPPTPQ